MDEWPELILKLTHLLNYPPGRMLSAAGTTATAVTAAASIAVTLAGARPLLLLLVALAAFSWCPFCCCYRLAASSFPPSPLGAVCKHHITFEEFNERMNEREELEQKGEKPKKSRKGQEENQGERETNKTDR